MQPDSWEPSWCSGADRGCIPIHIKSASKLQARPDSQSSHLLTDRAGAYKHAGRLAATQQLGLPPNKVRNNWGW